MPDWNKFISSGQNVNTTNNNQQTSVTNITLSGDLSFPNIKGCKDIQQFMNEIQHLSLRASQYANKRNIK